MHRDAHLSALSAAARVALSLAFISGCGSGSSEPTASTGSQDLTNNDGTNGTCEDEDGGQAPSCSELISQAFPTPGTYPGTKQDVGPEVAACCSQLLETSL